MCFHFLLIAITKKKRLHPFAPYPAILGDKSRNYDLAHPLRENPTLFYLLYFYDRIRCAVTIVIKNWFFEMFPIYNLCNSLSREFRGLGYVLCCENVIFNCSVERLFFQILDNITVNDSY